MNYEYLTFDYDAVDAPVDPYEGVTDNELVEMMVSEAKRGGPYYAIGWMTSCIKAAFYVGVTRDDIIRDIEYLKARTDESVINF